MIFLIAFLVIIIISFFLAAASMKDFQELPTLEKSGVYLIQNPSALTTELIQELKDNAKGEVISFERLFKGAQSALVVFGTKKVLEKFSMLNLLELEDYTKTEILKSAWEMGIKGTQFPEIDNIFVDFPNLQKDEQFWWQVVIQPQKQDWQVLIRAILITEDPNRRKDLTNKLQSLTKIIKVPKPLTSEQIYESYLKRAFAHASEMPFAVSSKQLLKLLGKA